MSMSKIRDSLFPIHGRKEITKFLLLGFMKFFIIFVLTLTRDTKDTLVVTQCGAEAIAFLKVYGVLPAAAAFIAIFAKMSSALSRQSLFYATCIPFFLFFFIFNSTIYPNRHFLEPSISTIEQQLGMGGVPAKILNHWTSALFFVVSEVYASVSIGILFWKFANDVVSVREAKRFYPLFAYMSSLAPIAAGQYVVRYASQTGDFASSLNRLTIAISMAGIAICCLHHIINIFVERTEDAQNLPAKIDDKKKKKKMNMMDSLRFLSSSHYLGLVTTLVLGYGIMYNFLEISWKSLVKRQYDDPIDYQRFMGNFSSLVGASTLVVILIGSNIIKLLGWRVGAISTPAVMSLLAIPFFACTVVLGVDDNPTVLNGAVQIGSVMILMSRACKYGLFDPTLQMSYIPLDEDSKVKGKAAIDVLGSRVGKSGASMVQQGFVFAFGDIISASPAVMVVFYAVSAVWIMGAMKLSVLYNAKAKEQEGLKRD